MSSKLGCYWSPGHNRPPDLQYIARLQPPVVRILDPDVQHVASVHAAAPRAIVFLRYWWLDDGSGEQLRSMNQDPEGTGKRHAQEWDREITRLRREATERNLAFPPSALLLVGGVNEPNQGGNHDSITRYNVAFLDECAAFALRASAFQWGVGWPNNKGAETPPDWSPYRAVYDAIKRGDHVMDVHEYWYDSGPADGWGWWAGRINKCDWDVPIIIGESGVDNYVDIVRWNNEGGNRGWRGNVSAEKYGEHFAYYLARLDSRILAVLPFATDYRDNSWESFDTQEAHPYLLDLPTVIQPPKPVEPPVVTEPPHSEKDWQRSRAFVRKWEGGYSNDPDDIGNWTGCREGVGELKGTKYGISACSYPDLDIVHLTMAEADAIYYRDYWQASGADGVEWPLCLMLFDTAVLHGVGAAKAWVSEVGPDPARFVARRLNVYAKMPAYEDKFWRGHVRRVAELLEVTGLAE